VSAVVRLIARRDIVGREWTFARGRHLLGRREASGWAVWPRRDPTSYIVCVPDELVRELCKPPNGPDKLPARQGGSV
jgi:hypothetical protein